MSQIPIRVSSIGPADHGKSTLFGYLVLSQIDATPYWKEIDRMANETWFRPDRVYTYLFDRFLEERRGVFEGERLTYKGTSRITTHINCEIAGKEYMFIDVPGHDKFLKATTSGVFQAQTAVLVVAATDLEKILSLFEEKELSPKTHLHDRHAGGSSNALLCPILARVYGFKNLIMVVSKMDSVDYKQDYFELAMEELLPRMTRYSGMHAGAASLIPTSIDIPNRTDINVITPANLSSQMNWYQGPTLLDMLAKIGPLRPSDGRLLIPVETVYLKRIQNAPLVFTGHIMRGAVSESQIVQVIPLYDRSTGKNDFKKIEGRVKSILPRQQTKQLPWIGKFGQDGETHKGCFEAGQMVGLSLHPTPKFSWAKDSTKYFKKGCLITDIQQNIVIGNIVTAEVFIPIYSRQTSVSEAWVVFLFGKNRGDARILSVRDVGGPFLSDDGKTYAGSIVEVQLLMEFTVALPDWKEKEAEYPRDIILRHNDSFCGGLITGLCFPKSIELSWEEDNMLRSSNDIERIFEDSERLGKIKCRWNLEQCTNETWKLTAFNPSTQDILTVLRNTDKVLNNIPSMTIIPNSR